ncbi:hypothetical protein BDV98DRAFT_471623, partial [Pterulicium gracile]
CALVQWFKSVGTGPHADFGMWLVQADTNRRTGLQDQTVVHLDTFLRLCHLIPRFGSSIIPPALLHIHSLSVFNTFWVNKFADHHAHEVA